MGKIESMTAEQERLMVEFREQYRAIGLSCEPADRPRAERTITEMYAKIGKGQPLYWWFDGQMIAELALNILDGKLGDNLRDNLGANLWDNLRANLGDNLRANLRANLRDNLWDNLRDNLGDNLWDNLWDNLRANLGANDLRFFSAGFWGQMDAYWIAYYSFPHRHLREMHDDEQADKLRLWDELARSCCWWWPYDNICICSERPLEIHTVDARLHRDGGPAFVSRDGWKMWYLNGVEVSPEIAETPADKLNPSLVLTEQNAEVRREIVRKVGVDRVCSALDARVEDESGDYQLLLLDLQDGRRRPYLKMLNPSIGTWHIEGVHPDCETVAAAIAWRNGMEVGELPQVLT